MVCEVGLERDEVGEKSGLDFWDFCVFCLFCMFIFFKVWYVFSNLI